MSSAHPSLPSKPVGSTNTPSLVPPVIEDRSPSSREITAEEPRPGFSRSGFAPIPHRHADIAPPPPPPARVTASHYEPAYDEGARGYEQPASSRPWDDRRDHDERGIGRDWVDEYGEPYDRKRRRSPSPSYSHQRTRRRSPSPPPRYHNQSQGISDPARIDYLLNFRQFAEWFRSSHPQTARDDDEDLRKIRADVESGALPESVLIEKHGMAKRYERYRKEYTSRQLYGIYLTHRESAWFSERYSPLPEAAALRRRVNRQGRVPAVQKYIYGLREGKWDSVNFDQSNDLQLDQAEPEGLDRALGEDPSDPLRIEVPPQPGQVFVKSVPPMTGRNELEEIFEKHPGFEWVALSEPSAKKGFHRVGWAQYAEGTDVDEVVNTVDSSRIDNFTFHMGVNATPIVGRIRVAPPLASTLFRLEFDADRARRLACILEDELLDSNETSEPIPTVARAEDGKKAESVEPADPKVDSTTNVKAIGPTLHERGSDIVAEVVARLLERESLHGEQLDEEQRARKAKITLDQYLSYLREGLNTCYYCVVPTSFAEELQRKCVGHIRAPVEEATAANASHEGAADENERGDTERTVEAESHEGEERERDRRESVAINKRFAFPTKSSDERWAESLDLKVRALIDEVDVADYGGRNVDDETKRLTAPHIKQEESDKYRCKQCSKLFRAPEFVIKHVASKHREIIQDKLDEIAVFNAFTLDPQHIMPSSTTPATVDDQLPAPVLSTLPAFNPSKPAVLNPATAASQPGFNMMQQQMMMMMHMQMMMQGGGNGNGHVGGSGVGAGGGVIGGDGKESKISSMSAAAAAAGLPPIPLAAMAMSSLAGMGKSGQSRDFDAALPPAPPGGEDPRARKGRVSYRDLDEPGGAGDGGLPY